jgi:hypothetical protein
MSKKGAILTRESLPSVPLNQVRANIFKRLKDELFKERFEGWMQNNNSMIESGMASIDREVKMEKAEVVELFFQSAEELITAFYRKVRENDLDPVETFQKIDWEKYFSELFSDYQTMTKLLVYNSKDNELKKIDKKIIKKKLPYLRIADMLDLWAEYTGDGDSDIKEFSTYRIKQSIMIAGNEAREFLSEAKKYIDSLRESEDFKMFTKSQLQKVFFDKYGNRRKVEKVLNEYKERINKFDNKDHLLTMQYITRAIVSRSKNAETYLKVAQDSLQEVYTEIEEKIINNITNYSEGEGINNKVKGVIRKYILGSVTSRSVQEIQKRKKEVLRALGEINWEELADEMDSDFGNIAEVLDKPENSIPKKIRPLIMAIFLKHDKIGNVIKEV